MALITLSSHDKPSLSIQNKIWSNHPISRDIQLQNFQGINPSNFWVGNLENRWLHKSVLILSDLYQLPYIQKSNVKILQLGSNGEESQGLLEKHEGYYWRRKTSCYVLGVRTSSWRNLGFLSSCRNAIASAIGKF